jgi:7-keto-8-aminopelargonate synthetase-like enzyme
VDPNEVDMWMGTLSKSFASVGGYIAGRKKLVEYLKYSVPGFVYSVGLAPPNAAAALEALRLMQAEPETVERLRENSRFFLRVSKELGLDTGPAVGAAVVPIIVGDSILCLELSAALGEKGINVQPIVYPAVDNESARLRFFISALHSEEQLRYAAETTKSTLEELRAKRDGGARAQL